MDTARRRHALDQLYELLRHQADQVGGARRLGSTSGRDRWPSHGVYLFFEPGELREDGVTPRIVRVGTHALTATARTTLWARLRAHRGNISGQSPGGGNHRGSVFRLHVGRALLARNGDPDAEPSWGAGSSAPAEVRAQEHRLEQAVSQHLGAMTVLWLEVAHREERASIERGLIGLLSNTERPAVDPPSRDWLGHHSPHPHIRASGSWNVGHVRTPPDAAVLREMRHLVE